MSALRWPILRKSARGGASSHSRSAPHSRPGKAFSSLRMRTAVPVAASMHCISEGSKESVMRDCQSRKLRGLGRCHERPSPGSEYFLPKPCYP